MATQARISEQTHERVVRLSGQTGRSQQEVLDAAVKAYERDLFLDGINEGFAAIRANPGASQDFDDEIEAWDPTLSDGL